VQHSEKSFVTVVALMARHSEKSFVTVVALMSNFLAFPRKCKCMQPPDPCHQHPTFFVRQWFCKWSLLYVSGSLPSNSWNLSRYMTHSILTLEDSNGKSVMAWRTTNLTICHG